MKQITALLILLIAATAVSEESVITAQQKVAMARAAECRTFITSDDKEIAGRPVDFARETETVMFETSSGAEQPIALSTLSEKDQAFIQDWLTGYSLFVDKKLRFTIRKKTDPDKEFKGNRSSWNSMFPNMKYKDRWYATKNEEKYDEVSYELRLENTGEKKLEDLPVEYCIYHQTTVKEEYMITVYDDGQHFFGSASHSPVWVGDPRETDKYPEQVVSNTIRGTVCFQDVPKGKKSTALTDPLKLVEKAQEMAKYRSDLPHEVGDRGTRNTRILRGKLLGIRCRVYVPTEAGNYAMVEFSTPGSLTSKTEWVAPK